MLCLAAKKKKKLVKKRKYKKKKERERETMIKEKWAGECRLEFLLKGWFSTGSTGIS